MTKSISYSRKEKITYFKQKKLKQKYIVGETLTLQVYYIKINPQPKYTDRTIHTTIF